MVLDTPTVAGTTAEEVLSTLPGCIFLSVAIFCHSDSIATVQDAVMKLHVEIKMKANLKGGCGPSKGARGRK